MKNFDRSAGEARHIEGLGRDVGGRSSTGRGLLVVGHADAGLTASPIPVDWVLEGDPVATRLIHSTSKDGTATTVVWECTPGAFNWFYGVDETIHIVSGSATLTEPNGATHYISPGSIVYFPAGSQARWEVHDTVRKVAIFRRPMPRAAGLVMRTVDAIRRALSGKGRRLGISLEA
ncbi:cupin domain-containing protein [Phenylobacterium montanum]|uniref:DUF861 domain-containing protein n=1 Tax=Phenylobacterium montanum TaxID=2823693 RepID=A0A975G2H5_9CAUL|nr:cupin domain-containing protein [Caulobacter sp. S6]QUD89292.1 DUF861 domain-containing protein [Caulobacter sp. S6]